MRDGRVDAEECESDSGAQREKQVVETLVESHRANDVCVLLVWKSEGLPRFR